MSTTFISFIGKGQKSDNNDKHSSYSLAQYDFGDGVICKTQCFAEAVRESGKYAFDEVLFIGTTTSSWSVLLEHAPQAEELCLELFDREAAQKELLPEDELAEALRSALCEAWGKPVHLCINFPQLLPENAEGIFDTYVSELLKKDGDILLDITHSFRWMPILLTSALSFRDAFRQSGSDVQIIYGELGRGVSPVRCLDVLVRERKVADAISLFFQKFEPAALAEYLQPYWREGADAIRIFGTHIQGNLFLPLLFDCGNPGFAIGGPLKRLSNALMAFSPSEQPAWVIHVHAKLQRLCRSLSEGDAPERLCVLAEQLAERKLYGQALIAVSLATEHSLVLAHGLTKFPGTKDELKKLKKIFRKSADNQRIRWMENDIADMRNLVAHGGLLRNRTNPSPMALPKQFEQALARQRELREYLRGEYQRAIGSKKRKAEKK